MEIEKKYLLKSLPFDMSTYDSTVLKQGYISTNPVIRLRSEKRQGSDVISEKYFLTVKGPGTLAREEFELELTSRRFEELWSKVEDNPIEKIRYYIPLDCDSICDAGNKQDTCGLVAELDEYLNRLEGLFTVEVEFTSTDEAQAFIPPMWFGPDITEDRRYGNGQLSKEVPPIGNL